MRLLSSYATVILNCLWLIPFAAFGLSKAAKLRWRFRITGLLFGVIVEPASLGLYSLSFLSPWFAPLGLLGLLSEYLHGTPPYEFAVSAGLVPAARVVAGDVRAVLVVVSALLWGPLYMSLGWLLDGAVGATESAA